jgi:hypothetical protein
MPGGAIALQKGLSDAKTPSQAVDHARLFSLQVQTPFKGSFLRKGLSQDEVDLRLMKLGVRLKVIIHSTPLDRLLLEEELRLRIETFTDVGNTDEPR